MEVLVLNTDFVAVGVIDSFKSLIWTDRYDSYGDFELCLAIESTIPDYVKEDYYLWIRESEHCMIIEEISINSDIEDGNYMLITGRSLESILERRIIWGQRIFTGNLQTSIQTMLTEAFITPSIADRKIGNFIFELCDDPKITALTIDVQFNGEDLYTVINKLCATNNIGFKIVLDESNSFVFSLYAGADRSYAQDANPYVVFSPGFENILSSNYYMSKTGLKTITLVAGEGEGADRKTTVVGSGSGLNRRELFTDARDISSRIDGGGTMSDAEYIAKLQTKGKETLAENIFRTAFDGEVEATQVFVYGEDFFIGDVVQIANGYGHEGQAYISELVMSQSDDGISVFPTFQKVQEEGGET